MKTPHKHADIIKAWAEGNKIEFLLGERWTPCRSNPRWEESTKYRVYDRFREQKEAFAKGEPLQLLAPDSTWVDHHSPTWAPNLEYRVKPESDPYKDLKEAFAQGKVIQIKDLIDNPWRDMVFPPIWNLPVICYRVKPESKVEECTGWFIGSTGPSEVSITFTDGVPTAVRPK